MEVPVVALAVGEVVEVVPLEHAPVFVRLLAFPVPLPAFEHAFEVVPVRPHDLLYWHCRARDGKDDLGDITRRAYPEAFWLVVDELAGVVAAFLSQ